MLIALLIASQLACRDQTERLIYEERLRVSGSSMEPTLRGERQRSRCKVCATDCLLYDDPVLPAHDPRCPTCGSSVEVIERFVGEEVIVERGTTVDQLRRLDCIVIEDDGRLEVKRLVGMPGESIVLRDGDLFVNGLRSQKTWNEFLSQCIVVSRWSEIVERDIRANETMTYHHVSNWPRETAKPSPHASPILDEDLKNGNESQWFASVRDIGFLLDFERPLPGTRVEATLWVGSVAAKFEIEWEQGTVRVNGISLQPADDLAVVHVDGRLFAGNSSEQAILPIKVASPESGCSPENPAILRGIKGAIDVKDAIIIRDINYRGPHGEAEFALNKVSGYHVLGDNVASSYDSRDRWPNGISESQIVGKLVREVPPTLHEFLTRSDDDLSAATLDPTR